MSVKHRYNGSNFLHSIPKNCEKVPEFDSHYKFCCEVRPPNRRVGLSTHSTHFNYARQYSEKNQLVKVLLSC